MEPPARAAQALSAFRVRIGAVALLLVGLAFIQSPGLIVSDTKFDLVEAPADFLARALHLWDGQSTFGQLQNQAYGYLWPMGPFFVLGDALGLPGWVVQRLWVALVMVVAFTGAALVARALGVRSDLACLAGGVAYAMSPRMLTVLGPLSIEAWPSALAPWVLLPLILGSVRGSPRRAAALSALAITMVGGVNAAATFAVIPMAALWLLTRTPGPRRRGMMLWWPLLTLLGTLWWLVPLLLLGAYSPAFLDYIESSTVTTLPTTPFDVLRGTSDWVPYIDTAARAGHDLITTPYLILDGAVVLLVGFVGLLAPWSPHRRFLALSVLVGVLMVGAGHVGATQGWFAVETRGALDGVLAPLRNVHKFDPILRLPLVIGFAVVIDRLLRRRRSTLRATSGEDGAEARTRRTLVTANTVLLVGVSLLVLAGTLVPAVAGRITPSGAFPDVPGYWRETASWLEDNAADGTTLLAPGSPFGSYQWGAPEDEPMQPLAGSAWAVRNVIPLTPEGTIRMLDAVEERFAQGEGSIGFAALLRRAGVTHLVVRNDLARDGDVPDPVVIHQTLADSPGLRRVASFGPEVGGDPVLETDQGRVVVNGGWQDRYPAVEVYAVSGAAAPAVVAEDATTVVGGPEDLLDLLDHGELDDAPSVLASDLPAGDAPAGRLVLTDGLRARERSFGRIHDGASAVLTEGDVRRTTNRARDYRIAADRWSTTTRLDGAAAVSASSSTSDADAAGGARVAELPYAVIDGRRTTSWVSQTGRSGQAWWQLDLTGPSEVRRVRLVGGSAALEGQLVRVRTEAGVSDEVLLGPGEEELVSLPAGETSWLRVEDASGAEGRVLSLAQVRIPGVSVTRRLVTPVLPEGWDVPDAVVLRAGPEGRTGCLTVDGQVRCVPGRDRQGEESAGIGRVVTLPDRADWAPRLLVRPRSGAAMERLAQRRQTLAANSSSQAVRDPRASALAAIDGDPRTAWQADPDDLRPELRLRWLRPRTISRVQVRLAPEVAARAPAVLTLSWPGGERTIRLHADGSAGFPAIRTDQLQLRVERTRPAAAIDFDSKGIPLGVGISELTLAPAELLPHPPSRAPRRFACGSGPRLVVNGTIFRSRIVASPASLAAGGAVPAALCDRAGHDVATVPTRAGENTLDVRGSRFAVVDTLTLTGVDGRTSGGTVAAASATEGGMTRRFDPPRPADGGSPELIVVRHNHNPGWEATQDGRRLEPVTVDGWQQGWLISGDAPVTARFTPDRIYRLGLFAGLATALGLAGLVVLWWRRGGATPPPPLRTRRLGPVPIGAITLLGAGLVAGWGGVLVAVPAVALGSWLAWRGRPVSEGVAWLWALPCLIAGTAYALAPWGAWEAWAGEWAWVAYLMLVPLTGALAFSSSRARRKRGGRFFQASAGRSTNR